MAMAGKSPAMVRDPAGDERDLEAGGPGHDRLEGETGPVDGRVGGGPAGDDHAEDAGQPEGAGRERAGEHVGVGRVAVQLERVEQRRRDPGHEVPDVHAGRGGDPVPGLAGEAEDRQVGHPDVHRHVAEPGEEGDVPEGELDLARQGIAAGPDASPSPPTRSRPPTSTPSSRAATMPKPRKTRTIHGRGDVGEAGDALVAVGRDDRDHAADRRAPPRPTRRPAGRGR